MATPQEIEEIKRRTDIVDLIEGYVPLVKAGANYKGLCPFHDDKNPSMFVTPSLNIYKCFSCGAGGDAITFYQDIEKVDFPEALKTLAERAGVSLAESKSYGGEKPTDQPDWYAINLKVAVLYHRFLLEHSSGKIARDYLKQRGIGKQAIRDFRLGFAPAGWDTLTKLLPERGIPLSNLSTLGLVKQSEQGDRWYDRFRERLMFPIIDTRGRILGFSGRVLNPDSKEAKYINSPDSPIYHKSESLFGLFQAQDGMRKQKDVILVEGNLDVVALHQAGEQQVVAPLGTAMTGQQLRLLKRFAQTIWIAFDGDSAGQKATLKSLELVENQGLTAKVIAFPQGQDPADLFRSNPGPAGHEAWQQAKRQAQPMMEYRLQSLVGQYDLHSSLGKRQIAQSGLEYIRQLESPVSQNYYLEFLGHLIQTPAETLIDELKKLPIRKAVRRPTDGLREWNEGIEHNNRVKAGAMPEQAEILEEQDRTELAALSLLLKHFSTVHKSAQKVPSWWFRPGILQQMWLRVLQQSPNSFKVETFYDQLSPLERQLVEKIYFPQISVRQQEDLKLSDEWKQVMRRLEQKALDRALGALDQRIRQLEAGGDEQQVASLLSKKQQVLVRQMQLS